METGVEVVGDDEAAVGDEMVVNGEVVSGDGLKVEMVLFASGAGVEAAAMKVKKGGEGCLVRMGAEVLAVPSDGVVLEEDGVNKKVEEICGLRGSRSGRRSAFVKRIASIRRLAIQHSHFPRTWFDR